MQLIFASQNLHKIEEVEPLIPSFYQLLTLPGLKFEGEIPETGNTLEENALQKAQLIYDTFKIPCFADDTGLEVEALNGEPGVYSARYAGEKKSFQDNMDKLLDKLKGKKNRYAEFKTVICLVGFGEPYYFKGILKGSIAENKRGENGFGYDPIFIPEGYSISMGEMVLEEKNKLSHRSLAVKSFIGFLKDYFGV